MAPEEESGPGEQASEERSPPVAEGWSPLNPDLDCSVFRLNPEEYPPKLRQKYRDDYLSQLRDDDDVREEVRRLAAVLELDRGHQRDAVRRWTDAMRDAFGPGPYKDIPLTDTPVDAIVAFCEHELAWQHFRDEAEAAALRIRRRGKQRITQTTVLYHLLNETLPLAVAGLAPGPNADTYVNAGEEVEFFAVAPGERVTRSGGIAARDLRDAVPPIGRAMERALGHGKHRNKGGRPRIEDTPAGLAEVVKAAKSWWLEDWGLTEIAEALWDDPTRLRQAKDRVDRGTRVVDDLFGAPAWRDDGPTPEQVELLDMLASGDPALQQLARERAAAGRTTRPHLARTVRVKAQYDGGIERKARPTRGAVAGRGG